MTVAIPLPKAAKFPPAPATPGMRSQMPWSPMPKFGWVYKPFGNTNNRILELSAGVENPLPSAMPLGAKAISVPNTSLSRTRRVEVFLWTCSSYATVCTA